MISNIDCWKDLQENCYFENHIYKGFRKDGIRDVARIERYVKLEPDHTVVVIGCGYGRESAAICKKVKTVYGIDVSRTILNKAMVYLKEFEVDNFVPVLADDYKQEIPQQIDLVYSIVTMQHITRDLAADYLQTLAYSSNMVIQFLETANGERDANPQRTYEPSVSWTIDDIKALGLPIKTIEDLVTDNWTHHWVHFA